MSKIRPSQPSQSAADATVFSFLIVPRFNMATLITMIEPLRVANYLASRALCGWEILSLDGADIVARNGMSMAAHPPQERGRRDEVVFVLASWGAEGYANRETIGWLRRRAREGARICAVELGCYIAARAGLLTGAQVATHWSWAPGFQEQFPQIEVNENLFQIGARVLSCAGGLAGVDLMLKLIAEQHGQAMAGEVADQMLHSPIRVANAPQRLAHSGSLETFSAPVSAAIALIEQTISEPLSMPEIARRVGASQRQLERQFRSRMGCTLVQFATLVRLQHARVLLISTKLSVREIAAASGFNTLSHFAHAFGKCFDRRPSDYRQGWPQDQAAPSWPGTLAAFLEALQAKR